MLVRRRLLVLAAALSTALSLSSPPAQADDDNGKRSSRDLTVATYNLYLGGDIAPVLNPAGDPLAAAAQLFADVQATRFPERALALAELIADERPHVLGLQEVSLWEVGAAPAGPFVPVLDFEAILLTALAAERVPYVPVATNDNFASPPVPVPGVGFVKLTDRDVIMVRADVLGSRLRTSDVSEQNSFRVNLQATLPPPVGPIVVLRGWSTVDVTFSGKTVRVANTHLEVDSFAPIRDAQAQQLAAVLGASPHPVVLLGDLNADPGSGAAKILVDALDLEDAWEEEGSGPGYTAGQDALLRNVPSTLDRRIDYVLYQDDRRPRIEGDDVEVIGEELDDRTASGLWPSDHAGVVAELELRGGRGRPDRPDDD